MIDKDVFLKPRLPTREVHLEVGTVVVRGLSRAEVRDSKGLDEDDLVRRVVSLALVDPQLTPDEVDTWQRGALGDEVSMVLDAIWDLSRLREDSAKATYKSVPDPAG